MQVAELARMLVELDEQKKTIEARLAIVKDDIEHIKSQLLEDFMRSGVNSISVDNATVFLTNTVRVRVKDWEKATAALYEIGAGDMVQSRANLNTLSAWARDYIEKHGELPAVCAGAIEPIDDFDVRVRRK